MIVHLNILSLLLGSFICRPDQVSWLLPEEYEEYVVRCYTRDGELVSISALCRCSDVLILLLAWSNTARVPTGNDALANASRRLPIPREN